MSQTENAFAKINLFLHVTGQREDGYHLLQSLAVFASLHDKVSLTPSKLDQDGLKLSGRFGKRLKANDPKNLIIKAITAYRDALPEESIPFQLAHLKKNLPIAGGIGGGSADAAAALRLLHKTLKHPNEELLYEVGLKLGADIPVCLKNHAAIMEGIGEKLTEIKIPHFGIVLANPGVSVSTPTIFKALAKQRTENKGAFTPSLDINEIQKDWGNSAEDKKSFLEFLSQTHNDLQPPAIKESPVVSKLLTTLSKLKNNLFVRMSGSGGTCFALFEDYEQAQKAVQEFRKLSPSKKWWAEAGEISTQL